MQATPCLNRKPHVIADKDDFGSIHRFIFVLWANVLSGALLWQVFVLSTHCALQQSKYHRFMFLQLPRSDPTYWFSSFWKIHLEKALSYLTLLRGLTDTGSPRGPMGTLRDPKKLQLLKKSGVILLGHVLQVPFPWYWHPNKSPTPPSHTHTHLPLLVMLQHESGQNHYRWLLQ